MVFHNHYASLLASVGLQAEYTGQSVLSYLVSFPGQRGPLQSQPDAAQAVRFGLYTILALPILCDT